MRPFLREKGHNKVTMMKQESHKSVRSSFCSVLLALILMLLVTVSGCDSSTNANKFSIPGTWEGFIGLGIGIEPTVKGDLTLNISGAMVCTVSGHASGLVGSTNYLEFDFTGLLQVDQTETILGDITIVRYQPGIDTLQATATMSGEFNLRNGGAFGEWYVKPDEAFNADGQWTVLKK